jgi:hypothetical protein
VRLVQNAVEGSVYWVGRKTAADVVVVVVVAWMAADDSDSGKIAFFLLFWFHPPPASYSYDDDVLRQHPPERVERPKTAPHSKWNSLRYLFFPDRFHSNEHTNVPILPSRVRRRRHSFGMLSVARNLPV